MPEAWGDLWPDFFLHIMKYTADGNAEHDDAEDALSGVCETMTAPKTSSITVRAKGRPPRR